MADPLFDNLTRTIQGDAAPATMRHWIGKNLVLDAVTGFDSENLKLAAWFTELRARMKENAPPPRMEEMRGLVYRRLQHERHGQYQGIEVFGRVYPLWNYMTHLCLYRFAVLLGWREEAELLRGWLRSHAVALVLAAGDGPGRQITDHKVAEGNADRGAAIRGDGALLPWWDPFIAWSGDRGCQRTRDATEWGRWQYLQESAMSPVMISLLHLETPRQPWETWWEWLRALDEVAPAPDAPLGCTATEVETLRRARSHEPAALREVSGWLWLPPVPFRIVRTSEGVWTISEVARGSSTAHLDACAWWKDGSTGFLCGDPGWRKAKGTDYVRPGRAWVDGTTAWAEREGRAPVSMPLPGGDVIFDLSVSLEGVSLTIPGEEGAPVTPEPIAPPGPVPGPAPGRSTRKKDDRKKVAVGVGIAALLGSLLSRWLSGRKGGGK